MNISMEIILKHQTAKKKLFGIFQVGPSGSGHFVKMVHNGIEYGDMQLICEIYHIMKDILKMSNDEIAEV